MSESAPALVPLFRSDRQMRILGALFVQATSEVSLAEVSELTGVSQATVSREVARLEDHGLVVSRKIGRTKLIEPNWDLAWAPELRSILMQTVGVLGRLAHELDGIDGINEAFAFGSWAARYSGEVGHQPGDIDVAIVGNADLAAVRRACRRVQKDLRVEVNPIVIDPDDWNADDDPFVAELRSNSLVAIPMAVASRD